MFGVLLGIRIAFAFRQRFFKLLDALADFFVGFVGHVSILERYISYEIIMYLTYLLVNKLRSLKQSLTFSI